jgi:leucyl aminopeptidase
MNQLKPQKKIYTAEESIDLNLFSGQVMILEPQSSLASLKKLAQEKQRVKIAAFLKKRRFKFKANEHCTFDLSSNQKFSVLILPKKLSPFSALELAREVLTSHKTDHPESILVNLCGIREDKQALLVDGFCSAAIALNYSAPQYKASSPKKQKDSPKPKDLCVSFQLNHSRVAPLEKLAESSEASARQTNLVRTLAQRAGNDLTPQVYINLATQMAKEAGLATHFHSIGELTQMKAGAFLAVAQGAPDSTGGILKISYKPKSKAEKKIALVGKGITFDTGGNNLKTGGHMFGMNNDMAGSAVVLALCLLAAQEKWPLEITGYMAITENILSAKAYRPNDVITSLKGKTIEVIDTDAEGRMILADTLTLASQEKPHLVIDFATLTGSVIRALGTQYSGGYSNRKAYLSLIRKAGVISGERVWSFPNDPDYGRCLKSDIADIKQCRHSGGVDHIEAAYFLSQFVEKGVDWVHIDLGAMDNEEPLAHIAKKPSGFGVRFGKTLIHLV